MTKHDFQTVDSAESARAFMSELSRAGLLYHPEDSAHDCLSAHALDASTLDTIESRMRACFDYLDDPCAYGVELLRRESFEELCADYDSILKRHNLPEADAWENILDPSITDEARKELSVFIQEWEEAGL